MLIACPNCQTSYDVSAASLGAEGRSVRCVRCREIWFATAPAVVETPAGEGDGIVSAAVASAQYQRRAAPGIGQPDPDPAIDDPAGQGDDDGDDDFSVDPNLAARAAGRSAAAFDDPFPDDAGARAVAMDGADAFGAHESPPLAPAGDDTAPATLDAVATHQPAEDIESFAARRARRVARLKRKRGIHRPSLATIMLSLFAANVALLGWRSDVVRVMPQTASLFGAIGLPVNLRGLAITDVTTTKEVHDGVTVLLVQGTIANIARQPRDVPRIRLAMRNAAGAEVYTWTSLPAQAILAPGDAEPFQTRLASPPADSQAVVVRFYSRRDLAGGRH
jgi:predicted Zn finger-like uncharacterized protein